MNNVLEINAICGEITREVAGIQDIDTLNRIKKYIGKLLNVEKSDKKDVAISKQHVLEDFQSACRECKEYVDGQNTLLSFDDVLNSL